MQKLVEVRRRAATVHSIRSVASTMATVASAKLARNRERAAGMRLYAERMREVIRRQQAAAAREGIGLTSLSPFLQPRDSVRALLLVHIAADRGMCGSYNSGVNRLARAFVVSRLSAGVGVSVHAKGVRGERFLRRRAPGASVTGEGWTRAGVTPECVDALCERVEAAFLSGEADEVWCTYTRFFSPLRRYPTLVRLLPLAAEADGAAGSAEAGDTGAHRRWYYDPGLAPILAELLGAFLRLQIEDVLLESFAAEQGARMIAMEEATERANRSLQDLTVAYNRLRRELITTDLLGVLFASALTVGEESAAPWTDARA
jgi:F-type H+-transporting ATPase subunit gamma